MKIQEDDKIKIKNLSNAQYNHNENKKSKRFSKFSFFILIVLIILFYIFANNIKNKNKQIKNSLSRKSINNEKNDKFFLEKLRTVLEKDEIFENEIMKKHTTFELGGPAKFFIKPKSINKIIKVLQLCKEYSIEYFILGNGSNLLVSDKGYDGLVINIHEENFSDLMVEQIDQTNYRITVGGGILMRTLAKRLCLLSLSGLEDIIDIPGTIGGGIIMNASAGLKKKLIYNCLDKVKVITPDGEIKKLSKKNVN